MIETFWALIIQKQKYTCDFVTALAFIGLLNVLSSNKYN